MYASRCFRASSGDAKLGCISCHDPHERPAPAQKVAYYRDRCLNCHADQGCSVPVAVRIKTNPDDSCVACHMPSTGSTINHTAVVDPRVSGVVMVNIATFHWHEGDSLEIKTRSGGSTRFYLQAIWWPSTWKRIARGDINAPVIVKAQSFA